MRLRAQPSCRKTPIGHKASLTVSLRRWRSCLIPWLLTRVLPRNAVTLHILVDEVDALDERVVAVRTCCFCMKWLQRILRDEPNSLVTHGVCRGRKHRVASRLVCQLLHSDTGQSVSRSACQCCTRGAHIGSPARLCASLCIPTLVNRLLDERVSGVPEESELHLKIYL